MASFAGPVLAGALMGDGVVAWVTAEGALLVDDGTRTHRVAEDALPELAVSPSGKVLAFARKPGADAGVWLVEGTRTPRKVSTGLLTADRPLFADEQRLVMVGADARGVAGVWMVRVDDSRATPRVLTNANLEVGSPWTGFIPVPADHASMRIQDGVLHYFDGESAQRVALAAVKP